MARTTAAKKTATEDVLVDAPHATAEDLASLAAAAASPMPTDHLGEPNIEDGALLSDLIAKHSRRPVEDVTPRLHLDPKTGATVATPKPSRTQRASAAAAEAVKAVTPKPKTKTARVEPKAKAVVERVPAERVVALIKELGLTNTQFGQALGVSPSMVSEFVGHGRGHLMAESRWADAEKRARDFAKKALK